MASKMESKEDLKNAVRDWVRIDTEMQTLKNELNKRKKEQKSSPQKKMKKLQAFIHKKRNLREHCVRFQKRMKRNMKNQQKLKKQENTLKKSQKMLLPL